MALQHRPHQRRVDGRALDRAAERRGGRRAGEAGDQRPERRRREVGEVALAVRQRGAEMAGGSERGEREGEPGPHERIAGAGALAAPRGERRDQRADRDHDAQLQMALERRAAEAARRAEQVAGAGRDRRGDRGDDQQREPCGEPRRAGAPSKREQFERAGEQQERDREVDEQRVEAADEGRGIAHASRSFTTWPCTSVSR